MASNANLDNTKVVGLIKRTYGSHLLDNGAGSYGPQNQCCAEKSEFKQFILWHIFGNKDDVFRSSNYYKRCRSFRVLQFRITKRPIWSPYDRDIILGIQSYEKGNRNRLELESNSCSVWTSPQPAAPSPINMSCTPSPTPIP